MDIEKERTRLEKGLELIELIEGHEKDINELKWSIYGFGAFHFPSLKANWKIGVNNHKLAIKRIEKAYNRLMCIDELTELRKFKQERTGIVESLRCEL